MKIPSVAAPELAIFYFLSFCPVTRCQLAATNYKPPHCVLKGMHHLFPRFSAFSSKALGLAQVERQRLLWPSMADPETSGPSTLRNAFGNVLSFLILLLIGVIAFSIRLFSVIKYESVIHEFDPYFNYRVTQFLTKNGIYDFWNWFDDRTWYPLGRVIGGTVYPGLTLTAGTLWWLLNSLNIPLSVETVCVFTAPVFSAFASWATYLLTKEVKGTGAGLTAAALLAMVI
ncbi:hypothetical protein M9H77_22095 [Catharanthus roseus]|uniref:Uncharacterized protein n=1 Tax=Catharanthus roseus TaxID=4058 RepID=A0ACC0AP49_CATRO|nr:hypothetical protein M9H77_22095 [Catharanthus roseus]